MKDESIFPALGAMGVIFLGNTEPDICELCGETEELRPYGPKGEQVCYECGMKDEEAMKRGFEKLHITPTTYGTG